MAVTVKQNPEKEVAAEILAEAIVQVAAAAQKLLASRLTRRALILLVHDACGGNVGKRDIDLVLTYSASLANIYVKQPAVKK